MKTSVGTWLLFRQLGDSLKQNFRMIDVGEKAVTRRRAVATGMIQVSPLTMPMIRSGTSPKGDMLAIAELAGIMAAKNTATILPLCHPIGLDSVKLWFELGDTTVKAFCEVICHAKTGVEMEALVGVNACLLTIYDLAKAVDPVIEISDIHLVSKEGGKSGLWQHPKVHEPVQEQALSETVCEKPMANKSKAMLAGVKCSVLTMSDRASQGLYEDKAGPILVEYLGANEAQLLEARVIPDDKQKLEKAVLAMIEHGSELILITGGTGLSATDITPETIRSFASKELTGFGEKQRQYGATFTKSAWLSRSSAFVVGSSLVVLFPGSPKAVQQGLEAIGDLFPHAIKMLKGGAH